MRARASGDDRRDLDRSRSRPGRSARFGKNRLHFGRHSWIACSSLGLA